MIPDQEKENTKDEHGKTGVEQYEGADCSLHKNSKHCIRGHNHYCDPGGKPPNPR